jgi:hypothetical protein
MGLANDLQSSSKKSGLSKSQRKAAPLFLQKAQKEWATQQDLQRDHKGQSGCPNT